MPDRACPFGPERAAGHHRRAARAQAALGHGVDPGNDSEAQQLLRARWPIGADGLRAAGATRVPAGAGSAGGVLRAVARAVGFTPENGALTRAAYSISSFLPTVTITES
jgi:hypothetical protein